MTSWHALACGLVILSIPPVPAAAQAVVPMPPFRSVEVRNGGHAIIRYGPTQRVTVLKGDPDDAQITIAPGGVLVIDKCKAECAHRYELEVEIVTPAVAHLTQAHGGWIQSRGSFPRQAELTVTVEHGGTIDIRSMSVASLTASVLQGGRIFTKPLTALVAHVEQGGNITYWGDARVTQSIEHGGVIVRGSPSDADEPILETDQAIAPAPPVPPTPTIRRL
jgi:Putative auto-transporter adhesin, head GIN domain